MRPNAYALAIATALGLSACGGGDTSDRWNLADPQIRFVDALRGGEAVTLYRDEVKQSDATNVGYKFASRYFDVSESTANWSVRPTSNSSVLANIAFQPERGDRNTLIALNDGSIRLSLIKDPYRKAINSTDARVRLFGAASNAQALDVYLTPLSTNITNVSPSFASLAYKQSLPVSGDDSVYYGAGTYKLRATSAGSKTVVFSASVNLTNNADLLLVALPATDSGSVGTNAIKFLVVQGNDSATVSSELLTEL